MSSANTAAPTSALLSNLHRVLFAQAWSKVLTFVCNVFIVRLADPATYGTYAVELTLALNIAVFLTRDALRNVTGRFDRDAAASAFAVSLLVAPVGVVVAALVLVGLHPHWALGVVLSAALVELATEPFFAVLHAFLFVNDRLKLDAIGTVVRCAVVLSLLATLSPSDHLLAFAFGQLAYASVLFFGARSLSGGAD
jgi:oligosaccharide translocation protein RFT1